MNGPREYATVTTVATVWVRIRPPAQLVIDDVHPHAGAAQALVGLRYDAMEVGSEGGHRGWILVLLLKWPEMFHVQRIKWPELVRVRKKAPVYFEHDFYIFRQGTCYSTTHGKSGSRRACRTWVLRREQPFDQNLEAPTGFLHLFLC